MPIFGKDHTKDINYLNDERLEIWKRMTILEKAIEEKPSDIEKQAKQALRKASEYKNRAKEAKIEIDAIYSSIKNVKDEIEETRNLIGEVKAKLVTQLTTVEEGADEIDRLKETTNTKISVIENKIEKIDDVFLKHPELESEVNELDETLKKVSDSSVKINALLKNAANRKSELDEIYYEIVGNEVENDETGEPERTEGLRDNLENQYKELEENLKKKNKEINQLRELSEGNFDTFLEEKNEDTDKYIEGWKKKYEEYEKTIEKLLPRALTTGLSSAFSKKKDDEIESFKILKYQFIGGIVGLVIVSLIPFGISLKFLVDETSWDIVINRAPRLILAILPLYLPVLWLAYSANKKMNLSKRLIEEYSHKEVLSRTFEGLSNQIENLEDNDLSKELRVKLLYDFLVVSSENPGKLISNYESSDHPVMDVLEKSYKLEGALDKLGKLPGFSKIAKVAEARTKSQLKSKAEKIKKGIDAAVDIIDE